MNLRQLRFFLQIAELGSVNRAAALLHIAQPALSRHLRQLESELGVTLFRRTDRGVTLTIAGHRLREKAATLLQLFDRVRQEIRDEFSEPGGELTIVMPPSMLDLLTAPAIVRVRELYPAILLRVVEGISGIINPWSMVADGRADLAVGTNVEPLSSLEATPLLRESLWLIGPLSANLHPSRPVELDFAIRQPLVLTSRPTPVRMIVESALTRRKLAASGVLEVNTPQLAVTLVEAGTGWTILPFCSVFRLFNERKVAIAPINELEIAWTFIQARDRQLSLAGEHVKRVLAHIAAEQAASGKWLLAQMGVS